MGRWSRRYTSAIFLTALFLICGVVYRTRLSSPYDPRLTTEGPHVDLSDATNDALQPQYYPADAPKLTIIAIWNPGPSTPLYLPNFFASVAGNPSVDVLFIKDDRHEVGCSEPLSPGIANVREVCLSSDDYWGLHANFLCEHWGGCTAVERETVMSKMFERRWGDRVHAYFRPFRHEVFRKWLNPATPIWGVCDMDTILGSFERNFPWDEAEKYDILFPSNIIDHDHNLVYVPGHLAFFRNSEHLTAEFMKFPGVASLDGFLQQTWMDSGAPDEAEWSHWAFTHTDLTFLRFPGLVAGQYHLSSPNIGTFSIDNGGYWSWAASALTDPSKNLIRAALFYALKERAKAPRKALFSSAGEERLVTLRDGEADAFLWFPQQYAVDFFVPQELITSEWGQQKKYLIRRERGGPVYYRTEPMYRDDWLVIPPEAFTHEHPTQLGSPMYAFDCLYNHFQVEKFSEWWKLPGLPDRPIASNEVLYVDKDHGAWVWNERGRVVFSALV